ncbi:carbon storage regulator [Pseudomonas fulva]|nr:carbon storage regulator [Pseudomonas fulva]MBF8781890.1 carbon storage regulator [Pseudomonas fulva]
MLVFGREVGEFFVIGDKVRIKIVGVSGGDVRLGIIAPRSVTVNRLEVHERMKARERAKAPFR